MADADAEQQPAARNRKSIAVPAPVHAAPLRITKRDIAMAGGDTLLMGLKSFKRGSFGIRTTFVDAPAQPSTAESASKSAKKAWNELITAMGATEQVGRPLTGALKKAWARPWLEEANAVGRTVFAKEGKRAREEAAAAARKAAKVGSPPKGGKGAGKGGKGGQSKPTCASWRASGKCANHDADQCPNHHPKGWKDSGEP